VNGNTGIGVEISLAEIRMMECRGERSESAGRHAARPE
jgi:hypothetical protein